MVKRISIWVAALAVIAVSGAACKRMGGNQEEAVRQGVIDYLSKRANLNISAMNVTVSSVVFRQDEADAVVSFTAKGANPGQPMSVRYVLERRGERWMVKNREEKGNPHGAGMAPPPGAAMPPGAEMPPGHSSVGSAKPQP